MPPKRKKVVETGMPVQPIASVKSLELFDLDPVQLSITSEQWQSFTPLTQVQGSDQSIRFSIPAVSDELTDSKVYIEGAFQIVDGDDTPLGANVEVAPISNSSHSWIADVDVALNGVTVSGRTGGNYPYIAYVDSVFETNVNEKVRLDALEILYQNMQGKFDTMDDTNPPFKMRKGLAAKSDDVYFFTMLKSAVFKQNKAFLPNVRMDISIRQKNDSFRVMSGRPLPERNQKLKLRSLKLWVKRLRLVPGLYWSIMKQLAKSPTSYPIERYAVQTYSFLPGTQVVDLNLLPTQTVLPHAVYLLIIGNDRYNGNLALSPFELDLALVSNARLSTEGKTFPSELGLNPNAADRKAYQEFFELQKACGMWSTEKTNGISFDDYLHGYGIIAFSLHRVYVNQQKQVQSAPMSGSLRAHVELKAALALPTTFIWLFCKSLVILQRHPIDLMEKFEETRWYPPLCYSSILAGVSGSGKSHFVFSLIRQWNHIYPSDPIRKIIIIYNTLQDIHVQLKKQYGDEVCVLSKELTNELLSSECTGDQLNGVCVIVLDDANIGHHVDSELILECAIARCHHQRMVLYILVQNMTCSRSKTWITIRRNCSQLFLFSLSRDQYYLKTLNSELFGATKSKHNLVKLAYDMSQEDSRQEGSSYFYLWIDSSIGVPLADQMKHGFLPGERKILYRVIGS